MNTIILYSFSQVTPAFDTIELTALLTLELDTDELAFDEPGKPFVEPKVFPTAIGHLKRQTQN